MDIYRPQHEPLMVRNFLQQNNPDDYHLTSPYRPASRCSSIADSNFSYQRSVHSGSYNSPHPRRVKTMKGLLGLPICVVDDEDDFPNYLQRPESRYSRQINVNSQQAPLNTLNGLSYTNVRNIPQGTKMIPILKRKPEPWQEELKALTEAVFFDTLKICDDELKKTEDFKISHHPFPVCRPVTPTRDQIRRSVYTQVSSSQPRPYSHSFKGSTDPEWQEKRIQAGLSEIRKGAQPGSGFDTSLTSSGSRRPAATQLTLDDNYQQQVFDVLCRLLNTTDTTLVASWLSSASDREKSLILQFMRSGLTGAYNPINTEDSAKRPQTALAEDKTNDETDDSKNTNQKKSVSSQASLSNEMKTVPEPSADWATSRPVSRSSSVIQTVPSSFPNLRCGGSHLWGTKEKRHPRASVLSDKILSSRPVTSSAVTLRYTNGGGNASLKSVSFV